MRFSLPLAALLLLVCPGCMFSRVTVNRHVAALDTSWIVPGKTTREQIISRLGYPASQPGEVSGSSQEQLRYQSLDTRGYSLEAGFILTPTFEKTVTRSLHDLLITFDKQGTVTRVSRVEDTDGTVRVLQYREVRP